MNVQALSSIPHHHHPPKKESEKKIFKQGKLILNQNGRMTGFPLRGINNFHCFRRNLSPSQPRLLHPSGGCQAGGGLQAGHRTPVPAGRSSFGYCGTWVHTCSQAPGLRCELYSFCVVYPRQGLTMQFRLVSKTQAPPASASRVPRSRACATTPGSVCFIVSWLFLDPKSPVRATPLPGFPRFSVLLQPGVGMPVPGLSRAAGLCQGVAHALTFPGDFMDIPGG